MGAEAIVFPGMTPVRFSDIGKFMLLNPDARRRVEAAGKRLGYPLVKRFRETEGDYSRYAQASFLVNCLALADWAVREFGVEPSYCTGPSFGAKTAAVYTGALSFEDGVWMTAELVGCIEEYFATEHTDVVTHSFVRVPEERLAELVADLSWHELSCHVDRDLFMVSLRQPELDGFMRGIRGVGGLSLYTMRPPMHAKIFDGLRRKAEDEIIGRLEFADPSLPIVSDQDGSLVTTAAGVKALLLDGYVNALRWPAVVDSLKALGVTRICLSGPDSLFGRVSCTTSAFEVLSVTPKLAMQPKVPAGNRA